VVFWAKRMNSITAIDIDISVEGLNIELRTQAFSRFNHLFVQKYFGSTPERLKITRGYGKYRSTYSML
jgi:hypothetical protein